MSSCTLSERRCQPCEGGVAPLDQASAKLLLATLPGWELSGQQIEKTFTFKNHYETMAFVNAIAWVSHRENHHPDLRVGYRDCQVSYSTHAIEGLSDNDFICAAKLEKLLAI